MGACRPDYKPYIKFCEYCGIEFRTRHNEQFLCGPSCSAIVRGNKQRDRGFKKTYRKLNGKHEHRVIMEKILGRFLTYDEIVHHKDGNRRNNSPENLEITNRSDHAIYHNTKNKNCTLVGCTKKHCAKGLCQEHYDKERRKNY